MHFHSFALTGVLSSKEWQHFLYDITKLIGMNPVYTPAVWDYPLCDAGGKGQTIVQPITESFLAVDAWPDHKGAYLVVCSCKSFEPHLIKGVLRQWGLSLAGEGGHSLRIPSV